MCIWAFPQNIPQTLPVFLWYTVSWFKCCNNVIERKHYNLIDSWFLYESSGIYRCIFMVDVWQWNCLWVILKTIFVHVKKLDLNSLRLSCLEMLTWGASLHLQLPCTELFSTMDSTQTDKLSPKPPHPQPDIYTNEWGVILMRFYLIFGSFLHLFRILYQHH